MMFILINLYISSNTRTLTNCKTKW